MFHYVFLDISFSQISGCHSAVLDDFSFRVLSGCFIEAAFIMLQSFMSHDVSFSQILYFIQRAFMMFHSFWFHDVSFRLLFGETESTRLHWKLSLVWITCLGYSWWVIYITDWDVPFYLRKPVCLPTLAWILCSINIHIYAVNDGLRSSLFLSDNWTLVGYFCYRFCWLVQIIVCDCFCPYFCAFWLFLFSLFS